MRICIFEDTLWRNFLPLVYLRPVYDLRCGTLSLREKIEAIVPRATTVLLVRDGMAELLAEENPGLAVNALPDDDLWFVNGRVIADDHLAAILRSRPSSNVVYATDTAVAAAFCRRSSLAEFKARLTGVPLDGTVFSGGVQRPYDGVLADYPWNLVHHSAAEIEADFRRLKRSTRRQIAGTIHAGAHLVNRKNILVGRGSSVRPGAVLDADEGPVVIGRDVTVMPNAVITGPAFIGDGSLVKIGAKIYPGCSIGTRCKVGGEIESSIIQSYSNKQHEGFLGHSYLGSWVNIGADTNTSDLKNTYGPVKVTIDGMLVDTGLQFVGLTMGDHSKSGINVMFNTGTVAGVSCNLYGAGLPPKVLPSFTWGGDGRFSTYDLEKSLDVARRVMKRREKAMTTAYEKVFRGIFPATAEERRTAGIA